MTTPLPASLGVLLLVVSAAPPARQITELIPLLREQGWDVHVVATPMAATWIDVERVAAATGNAVHHDVRAADQTRTLPRADAVAVVPTTFNTINKWAAGINDTLALGILNEALGGNVPVLASPYAKPALANHPVFMRNLEFLRAAGVLLTVTEALRPESDDEPFRWRVVVDQLAALIGRR